MKNLNKPQKIVLFLIIFNIILGVPILNQLGLTNIEIFKEMFEPEWSYTWWGLNLFLMICLYFFKDNEK